MKDTENKIKEFVKRVEDRTNDALDDSLMDEDAKEENFNVDYTDIVKNSAKAKISKLPWIIAIFLILIIAIVFCLNFFSNNPKTIFTQTVDGFFDYLESNINENVYDITDGNITFDLDVKSLKNKDIYNELSKISFNTDYVKDNSSNMSFIDLKTTYDGNDFISAKIYGDGNATYVYTPTIYEKYIKLGSNKLSYFISGNDIKILLDGLNQAFDKVIADEKILGSKENIDINGKNIKSYKTILTINKNNRNRISETIINTLKANEEFVSILAKMKGVNNSSIKKSLNNYLDKLKKEFEKRGKIDISLYTDNKTKEFLQAKFECERGYINLTKNKDKYSYSIKDNNILTNGDFTFTVNDNKTKYTYNLNYQTKENNKVLSSANFDLKYTAKKRDNFEKVDVSDNLDWNNVNDLEKLAIYAKILADPKLSKFLPIIQKVV